MPPSVGRIALRSISGRKAPKNIGGRNAGEDHAGTQSWLRQEVMRRKIAGGSDARRAVRGSDAAPQEASQVNRQRSAVLREEHISVERRRARFAGQKSIV